MTLCVGELGNHIFLSPSRKFLEDCMSGVAAPRAESIGDNTLYTATMKSLPQGGDLKRLSRHSSSSRPP
jgi:hypothetical protein